MARNNNQLFIKGHENPWAEVKTGNNSMMVLVHDLDHPDHEPMYIVIPTSAMAQQLADAISHSAIAYQDEEEVI